MAEHMSCQVCNENPKKYKCPACRTPYCSVPCFSEHKESCKQQAKSSPDFFISKSGSLIDGRNDIYHKDLIPDNKLEALAKDNKIREALKNPHLRHMLDVIDHHKNPESVLEIAMQEPIFLEFAETCVKTVKESD